MYMTCEYICSPARTLATLPRGSGMLTLATAVGAPLLLSSPLSSPPAVVAGSFRPIARVARQGPTHPGVGAALGDGRVSATTRAGRYRHRGGGVTTSACAASQIWPRARRPVGGVGHGRTPLSWRSAGGGDGVMWVVDLSYCFSARSGSWWRPCWGMLAALRVAPLAGR